MRCRRGRGTGRTPGEGRVQEASSARMPTAKQIAAMTRTGTASLAGGPGRGAPAGSVEGAGGGLEYGLGRREREIGGGRRRFLEGVREFGGSGGFRGSYGFGCARRLRRSRGGGARGHRPDRQRGRLWSRGRGHSRVRGQG